MSTPFSNTTDKDGILQGIERNCGFEDGEITGNETLRKKFTADVNLAKDRLHSIILKAGGRWQAGDFNHTKYPIITCDLESGVRDYAFIKDGLGNLVIGIYRVFVKDKNGIYNEIFPIDVQSDRETELFTDGRDLTGVATKYDKTDNGIFLNYVPDYDSTDGLKVYVDTEYSDFTDTDEERLPGFAGIFDEYLILRPSYFYAFRKGLLNATLLKKEMDDMEKDVVSFYGNREKDTRNVLKPRITGFR